jgi:hypothetical protein
MIESKYPATYVVFWPGQEVNACDKHTAQLQALAASMGSPVPSVRPLSEVGFIECTNCANEARRET